MNEMAPNPLATEAGPNETTIPLGTVGGLRQAFDAIDRQKAGAVQRPAALEQIAAVRASAAEIAAPPAVLTGEVDVDYRSWLCRNAWPVAGAMALALAVAGAGWWGHRKAVEADTSLGPKYTYTPPAPYTPSFKPSSPSVSVSPKASPSSIPTNATPTHSLLAVSAPTPKPSRIKPTKTALSPTPQSTKTTAPAIHCWTQPGGNPNVSDPLVECDPTVTPTENAGSGAAESDLAITSANTAVYIDKSYTVNGEYRVYNPNILVDGGDQKSGWIPAYYFN